MATTLLLISLSLLSVVYCQVGLKCMQEETIVGKVKECFSGVTGTDTETLHLTDGSLAQVGGLLSEETCRNPKPIVDGLNCFYNFMGDCYNIRSVLPSRYNAAEAIKDACANFEAVTNDCVKTMVKDMTVCLVKDVQKRQMEILTDKVKAESTEREACRAYTYEAQCLETGPRVCPRASRDAFMSFMDKLVPNKCRYPGLMEVLKNKFHVKNFGLTRMNHGPR